MIEWEKTETGECDDLRLVPKGARILAIDDVPVFGMCEACNHPVLETDGFTVDDEGIILCDDCNKEFLKS